MSEIDCPSRLTGSGTETDRDVLGESRKRTAECEACGYVWNVVD